MLVWSYLYYVLFPPLFKFDMNRLLVLFILLGLLFGQARIGEWQAYTAPLHINDIAGFEKIRHITMELIRYLFMFFLKLLTRSIKKQIELS